MNADRLHALLKVLKKDIHDTQLAHHFSELHSALERAAGQPHPQHQAAVGTALQDVYNALNASTLSSLSPAWVEMLKEIEAYNLLGGALKKTLEEIFSRNQITFNIARDEVEPLYKAFNRINEGIDHGTSGLSKLAIGSEILEPGECEVGFMIPRGAIDNNLDEFSAQCHEFDLIFGTFSEIVLGHTEHYKIKTISSTDFNIILGCAIGVGAVIVKAVEKIVGVYKQILEVKKLRSEMRNQGVSAASLKTLDAEQNQKMERAVEELAVEIVDANYRGDGGRKNELTNALRISLRKIANRIDLGYHIEVRIAIDDSQHAADPKTQAAAKIISQFGKAIEFVNVKGEPILALPEDGLKMERARRRGKKAKEKRSASSKSLPFS